MARIRCSGGIVLEGPERVWLAADPGTEVRDWRRYKAAPVVVGPPDSAAADVTRARQEALLLVEVGGPVAAAAGVDLGHGFRSGRLDGGGESRRDAVLAAIEVLGVDELERIGDRSAVLVALFGVRATRRVGATALDVLARCGAPGLRLAVAASDLLGPEQVEDVLGWNLVLPPGIDPVPRGNTALFAEHLATALAPFSSKRRLTLLRSVWESVVAWHRSEQAMARARRRGFSVATWHTWRRRIANQNDTWWRNRAAPVVGPRPSPAAMLAWVPDGETWREALSRAFQEAICATALLRTALAAEDQPLEAAVLAHLDELAYAATAHLPDDPNRAAAVCSMPARNAVASDRAAAVAAAVVRATDPGLVPAGATTADRRPLPTLLKNVCELARAVLQYGIELCDVAGQADIDASQSPALAEWRRLAGYSRVRDPHEWSLRPVGADARPSLAERIEHTHGEPATVERLDDALWLMDLADAVAGWLGHERAAINWLGVTTIDVDVQVEAPDSRLPLLESVPLAIAGAAQLMSLGATPPRRPTSWSALATALLASADALGFADTFDVAPEVLAWNGRQLAATGLTVEVGRTARQLAEWGNYMGNCIGGYADEATRRYSLVALRDPTGRLLANIAVMRRGAQWRVMEALGRFNEDLSHDLQQAIAEWAAQLQPVSPLPQPARAGAPARRSGGRGPHGRRAPARERLARAAAELGDAVGDLRADPAVVGAEQVLRPIAAALGWSGGGNGDSDGDGDGGLSLFVAVARPRRAGPLAAAVANILGRDERPLAELWEATALRPLSAALAATAGGDTDLRRLADPIVPPSLRLALREPRVWHARVIDLAGVRLRRALGDLLAATDPALDRAVVAWPHTGFLTAAVLTVSAAPPDGAAVRRVRIAEDGTVPGRPRSSVVEPDGVWQQARATAVELGAAAGGVDRVLAAAPGGHVLVPAGWLAPRGWDGLWAHAHRVTRDLARARTAAERADSKG